MNWNAIRTFLAGTGILTILGPYIIDFIMNLLGCSGDTAATAVCTGGTLVAIPAWLQALVGGLILAIVTAMKGFLGTGTFTQNLFAPQVPVVPALKAGPGTVTQGQVDEE